MGGEGNAMAGLVPVSGPCFHGPQRRTLRRISLSGAGLICVHECPETTVKNPRLPQVDGRVQPTSLSCP